MHFPHHGLVWLPGHDYSINCIGLSDLPPLSHGLSESVAQTRSEACPVPLRFVSGKAVLPYFIRRQCTATEVPYVSLLYGDY